MTIQKDEKPGSTRRKRMTAKRKQEAVKRVDRGEPIELVARSFDVTRGRCQSLAEVRRTTRFWGL